MAYALHRESALRAIDNPHGESEECATVATGRAVVERDSLSENFLDELDAWARHAMARNGFGDY